MHVNLFDRAGRIFASANVPVENCDALVAQIRDAVATVLAGVQKQ